MGCLFTFSLGVIAGLDFALSRGWSMCFHELLDMFSVLIYFVFFHDVLYSAFMTHHFWSTLPEGGPLYRGLIALSS